DPSAQRPGRVLLPPPSPRSIPSPHGGEVGKFREGGFQKGATIRWNDPSPVPARASKGEGARDFSASSSLTPCSALVWCLRNNYTFVALKLAWGEARGRECIPSDTRPTERRSPRSISAQPEGRHVFWADALLLAPHRSTGYARRSRLASAQNPLPRMYSYF